MKIVVGRPISKTVQVPDLPDVDDLPPLGSNLPISELKRYARAYRVEIELLERLLDTTEAGPMSRTPAIKKEYSTVKKLNDEVTAILRQYERTKRLDGSAKLSAEHKAKGMFIQFVANNSDTAVDS